jgi:biopolymer transport protein ExbB
MVNKLLEFVFTNFTHVLPILIAGVFGIAIMFERVRALFMVYPLAGKKKFLDRVRELVLSDRVQDAIILCDHYPKKAIPQIVKQGLLRAHLPENMISDGLNITVGEWADTVSKRTGFLSMIANVATLMGLFGTIVGLIQSFEAVGAVDASQKSAILAAGISTAMNATMIGLAVAIPCMVSFSFLMNKSNRLVSELDLCTLEVLDIIRQRSYGVAPAVTKRVG